MKDDETNNPRKLPRVLGGYPDPEPDYFWAEGKRWHVRYKRCLTVGGSMVGMEVVDMMERREEEGRRLRERLETAYAILAQSKYEELYSAWMASGRPLNETEKRALMRQAGDFAEGVIMARPTQPQLQD